MKVTNWCKSLRAVLLAAGFWVPSAVYAQIIPLDDPSFEDFAVPPFATGGLGYAYSDTYRPTSAWVDDLDSPVGYAEDDGNSNWLYDAAYAQGGSTARKRPAPRTGIQAMHGIGYYNAQETSAVFEAGKTYSFSIWAQGDDDATPATSRAFLYIFDGSIPFSEANSLNSQRFAPDTGDFANRADDSTAAQSQAMWTQITLRHSVFSGAPEVGHPVGVGFWVAEDGAVDDATLRADPNENFLLFLEVNTLTGQTSIKNQTGETVNIDYYEITSAAGSLNATAWNSLQEQNLAGFPAGNGSGNGWEQAGSSDADAIGESYLMGSSGVANSATIGLGAAYNTGVNGQDLVFRYGALEGGAAAASGDYNGNGVVDAADYTVWRDNLGSATTLPNDATPGVSLEDYNVWKTNFGSSGGPSGPSTLVQGFVRYVGGAGSATAVPESSTIVLVGFGLASLAVGGWRKSTL